MLCKWNEKCERMWENVKIQNIRWHYMQDDNEYDEVEFSIINLCLFSPD